ncbi:hypothetical protein B0T20DRAFT_455353 [Sordaria brevicollis]|uniref:Uncharacterized protein n=1 Tax=Sordaria brevicollis TaxID=83679 RepID=A0AAE0U9F3_SORBR|nr:hypothetical protein B0T20DRAFT_455353 [Sordaria brevicollis]
MSNETDKTPKAREPHNGFPNSLARLRNTETVVNPPPRRMTQLLLNALPTFNHAPIIYTPAPPRSESKLRYRDPNGTCLLVLTTADPALNDVLKIFFTSIYVPSTGHPDNAFQPREPGRTYHPIVRTVDTVEYSIRHRRRQLQHQRQRQPQPPSDNNNPAHIHPPTISSQISGAGNQTYQLATAMHGAHNRIAHHGNRLMRYAKRHSSDGLSMSWYKTVIFVAVHSFIELPWGFEKPIPDRGRTGTGPGTGDWDGRYNAEEDRPEKRPVDYSVIMLYNPNRGLRQVVVTKGVTVNEGWVKRAMGMGGFEDEDAEAWMMPGKYVEERKGRGRKVMGRKTVGEQMKTEVENGTGEFLEAGDWQKVAAGVSRYKLIEEALEGFTETVREWLT